MKTRRELNAGEVDALHTRIDRLLDRIGLETQPRVAARLLELIREPEAGLKEYADAIQTDWSLTGRLLRLANSAFYAQRAPVTRLDRAMVLLGLDRIKGIALGFYLSRSATAEDARELSRHVWGQSIYRASLCSVLARKQCPSLSAEAFVVGLMLDCGQPLMARLIGKDYLSLHAEAENPGKLFHLESERLEFTHVDVVATLVRRWKLPPSLARPIAWHHASPPAGRSVEAGTVLQRVAYYAGAVGVGLGEVAREPTPLPGVAERLFGMTREDLSQAVLAAGEEYKATVAVFSHLGDEIDDLDGMSETVQHQLIELMDEHLSRTIRAETRGAERYTVGGQQIEIEPGRNGEVVAYITGERGERLISCTVHPQGETPETVGRLLGLEGVKAGELDELLTMMRSMAA